MEGFAKLLTGQESGALMRIETARFVIRPFRWDDADALYALLSDPLVMRFIEAPYTREQALAFLQSAGLCDPPLVWAMEDRQTQVFAGQLIFHAYDSTRFELGWILPRSLWHTGAASEVTEAVLSYARKAGIPGLVIECAREQRVTRHIAEKFGFRLVEEKALCVYEKRGVAHKLLCRGRFRPPL